ncbi:2-phosphoglycerate kinase [Sporosarcina ureilytica]|uniref:2-phosphoglycerate kinase n=1 Tax=Sporosarcina ureilytica TaxID=298596 RepID=A0A1D8JH19_9BACL|nr:2-phosphoglycerate kinase [Sporosarcina ureilytica]AOV08007.1 2-phosphoglycerate kinase [Sporosarcina ureilytica]
MIILINAVGSTGKTLMAQRLLEKYYIPYLSIDHLKMGLYRGGKHCGFTPLDDTEAIGDKLWPILKGIIMTNIENGQHIIEGCYILPHYLKDLDVNYSEKIIPIFMGFSTNYNQQNFESKIKKYRNIIEFRKCLEERSIDELIKEHHEFKEQCLQSGVKYFEIENDYDKEILKIYDYIDAERLRISSV